MNPNGPRRILVEPMKVLVYICLLSKATGAHLYMSTNEHYLFNI